MLIFPREGDQRSRSRSQPSCSWEGACEGEGPNFVSSNGALVSFLILCNTSSSTDVSRITIHFMKNLRLLAAESLSPLVVGLFSSLSYGTRASWLSRIFCFLCIFHLSFKNPCCSFISKCGKLLVVFSSTIRSLLKSLESKSPAVGVKACL